MIASVKKGDKIVSNGGLHGLVTGISDDTVTIEVAPKVRVKISRGFISSVIQKGQ
jgi:preprotein translocase subunit YajC